MTLLWRKKYAYLEVGVCALPDGIVLDIVEGTECIHEGSDWLRVVLLIVY